MFVIFKDIYDALRYKREIITDETVKECVRRLQKKEIKLSEVPEEIKKRIHRSDMTILLFKEDPTVFNSFSESEQKTVIKFVSDDMNYYSRLPLEGRENVELFAKNCHKKINRINDLSPEKKRDYNFLLDLMALLYSAYHVSPSTFFDILDIPLSEKMVLIEKLWEQGMAQGKSHFFGYIPENIVDTEWWLTKALKVPADVVLSLPPHLFEDDWFVYRVVEMDMFNLSQLILFLEKVNKFKLGITLKEKPFRTGLIELCQHKVLTERHKEIITDKPVNNRFNEAL